MSNPQVSTAKEIWKLIPDFPGYEISNYGRVRSFWKLIPLGRGKGTRSIITTYPQRLVKPNCRPNKYPTVGLWKNRKRATSAIHKLVLEVFIGPPEKKERCRHLDGNKLNYKLTNLCWGTQKENIEDIFNHGTMRLGIGTYNAKLTDEQVLEVRRMSKEGFLHKEIAAIFKVDRAHISRIIRCERRIRTYG